MLRLAGRHADGAILNWLSADDVKTAVAEVGPGHPIAARIFVIPTADAELARGVARRMIAAYLNVTAYAEFQRWLGRGEALTPMWEAWAAGDRKGRSPPSAMRWSTSSSSTGRPRPAASMWAAIWRTGSASPPS